jgi:hypothetical protein
MKKTAAQKEFERWMPGWAVTDTSGEWVVAYETAHVVTAIPGEPILFVRQRFNDYDKKQTCWHSFYRQRTIGSGYNPFSALTGDPPEILRKPRLLEQYFDIISAAPPSFASRFAGISAAKKFCEVGGYK